MQIMKDHTFSSLVRLNIGGKKFCTTIDTLTQDEPDSMLAAMFRGRLTVSEDPDKGRQTLPAHFELFEGWCGSHTN
uniref:Potassium channel tetramerisation-type BTB domain-containing protein n=1 Tax=Salix viminalis TaxID=40686 RepID=A0A6N2NHS1_SALVM